MQKFKKKIFIACQDYIFNFFNVKFLSMEKVIAVIDMKAFYAFEECVERNLNPFTTPLVVCDPTRGKSTIVLSVTPYLKNMGVPSRCRRDDLPNIDGMIFAQPRMEHYVRKSAEIISIVTDIIGEDDLHIYSIDEFFVNLGPYLKMYGLTPYQLVRKIQKTITEKTGLVTTAGLSYNMLMAKVALDTDAKNKPPYIAYWTKKDVQNKLWKIKPLSKMWGISVGYERRLNALGINDVGQLANTDKNFLKQKFGIMGEQLWEHANGIDNTDIRKKYVPKDTSLSLGQVLYKDYSPEDAKLIIKEMSDDLCMRLREHQKLTQRIGLGVGYSYEYHTGFSHQVTLDFPTDDTETITNDLLKLFDKYNEGNKIRRIYLSFSKLSGNAHRQISLFDDEKNVQEKRALTKVIDELKTRYGKNIVLRGSSLLKSSTAKERHNQIGGHHR